MVLYGVAISSIASCAVLVVSYSFSCSGVSATEAPTFGRQRLSLSVGRGKDGFAFCALSLRFLPLNVKHHQMLSLFDDGV